MSSFAHATIGTFDFIRMSRVVRGPAKMVELITRRGVDGLATKQLGTKAQPYDTTTLTDTTLALAPALIDSYKALQGNFITVTDDFGRISGTVLVLTVHDVDEAAIRGAAGGLLGGAGEVTLTQSWTLVKMDAIP